METIKHFPNESNATERFNNELMHHTRKQTELLEQIAQLLKPVKVNSEFKPKVPRKPRGVKK